MAVGEVSEERDVNYLPQWEWTIAIPKDTRTRRQKIVGRITWHTYRRYAYWWKHDRWDRIRAYRAWWDERP